MVFYHIGLGLGDEKDITLRGLEAVKKCSKVRQSFVKKCSIMRAQRVKIAFKVIEGAAKTQ